MSGELISEGSARYDEAKPSQASCNGSNSQKVSSAKLVQVRGDDNNNNRSETLDGAE